MTFLIVYHDQYKSFSDEILNFLKDNSVEALEKERDCIIKEDYAGKKLIIVVGGDGTFLRSSHLNKDTPVLGINPNPEKKEGFYMQADKSNYKAALKKIIKKEYEIIELLRLKVEINSQFMNQDALNEIYIGDIKPYNVFNYEIHIQDKKEFQRSSGLIIGTPSGSNAWLRSAGGQIMKMDKKKFQYVARELYEGKLTGPYVLQKGILDEGDEIILIPKSKGILVIDSLSSEYPIDKEDIIKISVSEHPLKYILLNKRYKKY